MNPRSVSKYTPNQKIAAVNKKLGNIGILFQQGTTRVIYDTLTLDTGVNQFRFFEGVTTRTFPDTNVGASGTGLQVGESLSVDRMYLSVITFNVGTTIFNNVQSLESAANNALIAGDVTITLANAVILKPIPISSFSSIFNKSGKFVNQANFEFDTDLILPPLLEFTVEVRRIGVNAAVANTALRLTLEGVGAILAPEATY